MSASSLSPAATDKYPESSPVGFFVTIFTIPANALVPYKAPCGPFRISTLSRSLNPCEAPDTLG